MELKPELNESHVAGLEVAIMASAYATLISTDALEEMLEQAMNGPPANDPASAVIGYILTLEPEDGYQFLRYWNEGEFEHCRKHWPEAPDEVYLGAEVGYGVS